MSSNSQVQSDDLITIESMNVEQPVCNGEQEKSATETTKSRGKYCSVSKSDYEMIVNLCCIEGKSPSDVCSTLNKRVKVGTIRRIKSKFFNKNKTGNEKKGGKRTQKFNEEDQDTICQIQFGNNAFTLKQVAAEFKIKTNKAISLSSVERILKSHNFATNTLKSCSSCSKRSRKHC